MQKKYIYVEEKSNLPLAITLILLSIGLAFLNQKLNVCQGFWESINPFCLANAGFIHIGLWIVSGILFIMGMVKLFKK